MTDHEYTIECLDSDIADLRQENARLLAESAAHEKRHMAALRCINFIDDYLEYRWRSHDAQAVRDYVMNYIDMYAESASGKRE